MKKLITLSAYIDIMRDSDDDNYYDLQNIFAYNDFLKQPLKLGSFVACKNGKPLEKPLYWDNYLKGKFMGTDCMNYNKAQKKVVFEGWELVVSEWDGFEHLHFKDESGLVLYNFPFLYKEVCFENEGNRYEPFKTFADLAEATKDNPLTLKTQ